MALGRDSILRAVKANQEKEMESEECREVTDDKRSVTKEEIIEECGGGDMPYYLL